jgi:hypothetical protein
MLTLSLVMIRWDWIGIVTIRNDTRRIRWTNGTMKTSAGPSCWAFDLAEPEHDCALVLLDDLEKGSMVSPFWLESRRAP